VVGPAATLPRVSAIDAFSRTIALFNVDGALFAFDNRCPHHGGPLCRGRVGDAPFADGPDHVRWEREQRILRCPWHGWEFDMRTGQSWCDPSRLKVRAYPVTVARGDGLVEGPFVAETFPVTVEDSYVLIDV
jgi:3-phenylpropionate/trans-cinnamate dioxygenase ferredoxin subunit